MSPGRPRARRRAGVVGRGSHEAPRERIELNPGETCPDCGGVLRLLGEDVSEMLEFIAAKLKVVETVMYVLYRS